MSSAASPEQKFNLQQGGDVREKSAQQGSIASAEVDSATNTTLDLRSARGDGGLFLTERLASAAHRFVFAAERLKNEQPSSEPLINLRELARSEDVYTSMIAAAFLTNRAIAGRDSSNVPTPVQDAEIDRMERSPAFVAMFKTLTSSESRRAWESAHNFEPKKWIAGRYPHLLEAGGVTVDFPKPFIREKWQALGSYNELNNFFAATVYPHVECLVTKRALRCVMSGRERGRERTDPRSLESKIVPKVRIFDSLKSVGLAVNSLEVAWVASRLMEVAVSRQVGLEPSRKAFVTDRNIRIHGSAVSLRFWETSFLRAPVNWGRRY